MKNGKEELEWESGHQGHRQRLRDRFWEKGFSSFTDEMKLELLLTFSIPQADTLPLAKRLIARFKTAKGVFQASREELRSVPGVGERSALLLTLARSIREWDWEGERVVIRSTRDAARHLTQTLENSAEEEFHILCVNVGGKLIHEECLFRGSATRLPIYFRKIAACVVTCGAAGVIVSHNHPGGKALPSFEDIQVTKRLSEKLAGLDVPLIDHIIVAGEEYYSFFASGETKNPFCEKESQAAQYGLGSK